LNDLLRFGIDTTLLEMLYIRIVEAMKVHVLMKMNAKSSRTLALRMAFQA
jgi:hypothetical protein